MKLREYIRIWVFWKSIIPITQKHLLKTCSKCINILFSPHSRELLHIPCNKHTQYKEYGEYGYSPDYCEDMYNFKIGKKYIWTSWTTEELDGMCLQPILIGRSNPKKGHGHGGTEIRATYNSYDGGG